MAPWGKEGERVCIMRRAWWDRDRRRRDSFLRQNRRSVGCVCMCVWGWWWWWGGVHLGGSRSERNGTEEGEGGNNRHTTAAV